MTGSLRPRVVALLAVLGILAGVAGYLFGAPVSYSLLVPAMALVAVLVLTVGVRAGALAALLAAAAFLYVQLAAVERPLAVDFGSGSPTLDLPTLLRGAGATWLPTLLGVVALLIVLAVASLLRDGLDAAPLAERVHEPALDERAVILRSAEDDSTAAAGQSSSMPASREAGLAAMGFAVSSALSADEKIAEEPDGEAEASRRWPTGAAFVRMSLGSNTKGQPFPQVPGERLADIVDETLGALRESTVVWGEDDGKIRMILWGADDERANALVRRVEEAARRQFSLPLDSVVLALERPELFAQPLMAAAPEPIEPKATAAGPTEPEATAAEPPEPEVTAAEPPEPEATAAEPPEPEAAAAKPRPSARRPRPGATAKEPTATAARPARPKATAPRPAPPKAAPPRPASPKAAPPRPASPKAVPPRPAQPVPAPAGRRQPSSTATDPKAAPARPTRPKAPATPRARPEVSSTATQSGARGAPPRQPAAAAAQPAQPVATTKQAPATEAQSMEAEVALRGRPDGARVSSRNARGGS